MYLKEASTASGLSLQKAISPKEATEAISRKTKKLKRSPVSCMPSIPVTSRKKRAENFSRPVNLSMKRREKKAPARAAMDPTTAMKALKASTSRMILMGQLSPEGSVMFHASAPIT